MSTASACSSVSDDAVTSYPTGPSAASTAGTEAVDGATAIDDNVKHADIDGATAIDDNVKHADIGVVTMFIRDTIMAETLGIPIITPPAR